MWAALVNSVHSLTILFDRILCRCHLCISQEESSLGRSAWTNFCVYPSVPTHGGSAYVPFMAIPVSCDRVNLIHVSTPKSLIGRSYEEL